VTSSTKTAPRRVPRDPALEPGIVAHSLKKISDSPLDRAISEARDALIAQQHDKGYWLYELEADCTIPSEYIMMMHFLDEIDAPLEAKLCNYIRARQGEHGGWPSQGTLPTFFTSNVLTALPTFKVRRALME